MTDTQNPCFAPRRRGPGPPARSSPSPGFTFESFSFCFGGASGRGSPTLRVSVLTLGLSGRLGRFEASRSRARCRSSKFQTPYATFFYTPYQIQYKKQLVLASEAKTTQNPTIPQRIKDETGYIICNTLITPWRPGQTVGRHSHPTVAQCKGKPGNRGLKAGFGS